MLPILFMFWVEEEPPTTASVYFDFSAGVNGNGTAATPYNTWVGTVVTTNTTYYFKRGTTCDVTNFTFTAGAAGEPIIYTAWYNADGSDDTSQPRPIVNATVPFSTYASPKDYVILTSWDIRAPALTVGGDKNVIFMGNNSTVADCVITSNVGCIGSYGKSNVTIANNTLQGVNHVTTSNNNVLIVSDAFAMDNVTITGNTVLHDGGGGTTSNAMRVESTVGASGGLTNLTLSSNTIRPACTFQRMLPGVGFMNETEGMRQTSVAPTFINTSERNYCRNHSAIGARISRTPDAVIDSNTVFGMLEGLWLYGGGAATAATFTRNVCNRNMHFGLHFTTDAIGCTIEHNTCSYNGIDINDGTLVAYGRGIELSSAAGQARCASHTIRYNTCEYNFNWGGPGDNGSEGVGIGLDDATYGCLVTGNILRYNEGNGVQYYGGTIGGGTPAISDTGSNHTVANIFDTNCTASITDRRTGGTYLNEFCSDVALAATLGSPTYVANNLFLGGTPCAIRQNATCALVTIANNIIIDVPHAIAFSNTPADTYNNDFFSDTVAIQMYCSGAVDGNGEPTYAAIAYTGVFDHTFDPDLDANYVPSQNSSAIDAGYWIGTFGDYVGTTFLNPPDIGLYEVSQIVDPPDPPDPPPLPEDATRSNRGGGGGRKGGGRGSVYAPLPDEYWDEREERMREAARPQADDADTPPPPTLEPPVLVIDPEIAAQLEAAQAEIAALRANLLNVNSVPELLAGAERLRTLDAELPTLKSRLWKWLPAKIR